MQTSTSLLQRSPMWQVLLPHQRQQLLSLLGQWVLRQWQASMLSHPSATTKPGGNDEPHQRQDPT